MQNADIMREMSTTKPTIAVITNLLSEKQAVDAMMDNKTTFIRYKTEGESHVYTIGMIGRQKVVSTKLPMVGRELAAKISSGNTTTRLFGECRLLKDWDRSVRCYHWSGVELKNWRSYSRGQKGSIT